MEINRILPFLRWFTGYTKTHFKNDFVSGITVAFVLIPQSMAYAQLAGLPAFYGLYASFLPPMIAALFGSSHQLSTGPVAVVSLMTAASLEPLATQGSNEFIAYAIILAFTVGLFQFSLGVLRLGAVINFLSHPVVNGFTNAAAIIIATSQLSKLFGVSVDSATHHYETIIEVIKSAINFTHLPTLFIGIGSICIMYLLKKINPKIPYVLIGVLITTIISYLVHFEYNRVASLSEIKSGGLISKIHEFNHVVDTIEVLEKELNKRSKHFEELNDRGLKNVDWLEAKHALSRTEFRIEENKFRLMKLKSQLRSYKMKRFYSHKTEFYSLSDEVGFQKNFNKGLSNDERIWRLKIGNKNLKKDSLILIGGGEVVGKIPKGLPDFRIPEFNFNMIVKFLSYAIIISLLGFMEAIAIAKAMASKTGQRINPNQELIGQGLANTIGSFSQSFPVSGSFSRSAVNLQAGAVTGMSSVITSLMVVISLLFFTPLLYHLPQSVLAAIIMMAVIGLINVKGFIHSWKAKWYDGTISIITFIITLIFAPHLEIGIYTGIALSLGVFLYKSMRPKVSTLARHDDESLKDSQEHKLSECEHITLIRFEGPLFFANASYLEDEINKRIKRKSKLKYIIIVCNGINDMDASGEEALALLIDRVRSAGYGIVFSGVNETVMNLCKRTHLIAKIGSENIYPTMEKAILGVYSPAHLNSTEKDCPLMKIYKN
ncbi:SulP family inorganic anion transporter [Bacteroidetes/Chlorobi group bacterium ChocPot_Mid]|nr:MAG: SulP family inorganic anion transporter [Bacteroidetes/Chlorobi group bacterium ChocPot_Mid]